MVKRMSLVLVAFVIALSLSACMATPSVQTATALEPTADKADPSMSSYTDNLEGLSKYLKDCEVVAGDGMIMSFSYIGAIAGEKFTYKFEDAAFTCEIYEFDLNNLNDTAKAIIAQAKEKEMFTSLEKHVRAIMSDSGKFIMIPIGSEATETQKALTTKLEDNFKTFVGKAE